MSAALPGPAGPGRMRLPAGLLLSVLAHAAFLLWLAGSPRPAPAPEDAASRPLEVRWLPPPAPETPPTSPADASPPQPASRARPAPARPAAPRSAPPAAPSETRPAAVSAPETPPAAPEATTPAQPPLDLTVPPPAGAARTPAQQAAADPRANVRTAPADAMARRLTGNPQRTEQRMAQGGWIVRQGTRCWEVRPARANELHPFDATMRYIPHGVRACDEDREP